MRRLNLKRTSNNAVQCQNGKDNNIEIIGFV